MSRKIRSVWVRRVEAPTANGELLIVSYGLYVAFDDDRATCVGEFPRYESCLELAKRLATAGHAAFYDDVEDNFIDYRRAEA